MEQHRRTFIKQASIGLAAAMAPRQLWASGCNGDLKENTIFLFQGDSITHGGRGLEAWDLNHVMGHGYASIIAGKVGADLPEKHLSFYNRGISGHRVTDLQARWQKDTLDIKPDVLSILVGINDSNSYYRDHTKGVSVAEYEKVYNDILDQTKAQNPSILFVLGQPFILPMPLDNSAQGDQQRDVVERAAVVKRLAEKYNAVYVPYQDVFNNAIKRAPESYWIWDHIHPTVAGHELMAREWLKHVSKRISYLKKEV